MSDYNPAAYGESVGDDYDTLYPDTTQETDAAIRLIAAHAEKRPGRSVLELGIGTGRLALPLHRRGLHVAGIDGAERMIAQLRRKPDGAEIEVVIGDYATTRLPRQFSVVALVFNNIFDPRGRRAQHRIFANAAAQLEPQGFFIIEAFILNDSQRSGEWSLSPRFVAHDHVELQLVRYDLSTSQLRRTFVHLRPEGSTFLEVADTYASPGELDILAEVAGLRLRSRYATWDRQPFTVSSSRHVSVYELAPTDTKPSKKT